MWWYLFLIIAALLVVKPASTSMFVSEYGAEGLPFAYVAIALAAGVVAVGYARVLASVPVERLVAVSLRIGAAVLAALWAVHYVAELRGVILYALYVGVAVWGATSVSQFWILANTVFTAREAKRLFSFLGTGGIVGGAVGGYSTNLLAPVVGTEALLLVGAVLIAACIPVVAWVTADYVPATADRPPGRRTFAPGRYSGGFRLITRSRHLRLIATIVGISVVVAKLVDYQFTAIANSAIPDDDQLTAFFAFWLSTFNLLSLAIQLLVTRKIIALVGVARSLFMLPLAILLASGLVLVAPVLTSAIVVRLTDSSLKQSINKAGTELLYLPVPRRSKGPAKTFIDVFVDSVATGIGGLLLVISTLGFGLGIRWVALLTIALVVPWIYLIRQVRRAYLSALRLQMDRGKEVGREGTPVAGATAPRSTMEQFRTALADDDPKTVRAALDVLPPEIAGALADEVAGLLRSSDASVLVAALRELAAVRRSDVVEAARALLKHPDEGVRVEALAYLFERTEDSTGFLARHLADADLHVRTAALVFAARQARTNPSLVQSLELERLIERFLDETPSLAPADQVVTKSATATAIGEAALESLYPYLHVFLGDASSEVVRAGLRAAARSRRLQFLPPIFELLRRAPLSAYVIEALIAFGPTAIEPMRAALQDRHMSRQQHCAILEALGSFPVQSVVDILLEVLEEDDYALRYEATRSLNRLRRDDPTLRFDEREVEERIRRESRDYARNLVALQAQKRAERSSATRSPAGGARDTLISLLERRLDENLERVFRLLGLRYPPDAIHDAFRGLAADQPQEIRASAVEFLDNLLDPDLRRIVIPLVESTFPDAFVDDVLSRLELEVPGEKDCLDSLLATRDTEIVLATLDLVERGRPRDHVSALAGLMGSSEPRIAEAAGRILASIGLLRESATGDEIH